MQAISKLHEKHNEFTIAIADLSKKLSTVMKIDKKVDNIEHNIMILQEKNLELIKENSTLSKRLNNIEQYSYPSNIEINNIPYVKDENVEELFMKILQYLSCGLDFSNIRYYRTFSLSPVKTIVAENLSGRVFY